MPVEEEREAARNLREETERRLNVAGEKELKRLLRESTKEKFGALADNKILQSAQRLTLLEHLEGLIEKPKSVQTISPNVATSWEVWRSQLPYKYVSWGTKTVVAAGFGLAAVIAYLNTPKLIVESTFDHDVSVTWPEDGQTLTGTLRSGHKYGWLGFDSDKSRLRVWEPGIGYRTMWVDTSNLRRVTEIQDTPLNR